MIPSLDKVDGRQLAIVRIVVFGTWIVLLGSTRLSLLAGLPSELIEPNGLTLLVPVDLMVSSPWLLTTVQLGAILGCVLCVIGVRPFTPIALVTTMLLFVSDGLMKSIGVYDNHAQWAPLLAALVLALSPSADAWSVSSRNQLDPPQAAHQPHDRYRAPLIAIAAVVALAYTMIGARRIVDGALTVLADDSILIWSVSRTLGDDHYPWDMPLLLVEARWLLPFIAVGFALVTIAEILTPFALRSTRIRTFWLAVMVPFHVSTLVAMEIFFWENLLLVAVLFTGVPAAIVRLSERTSSDPISRAPTVGS